MGGTSFKRYFIFLDFGKPYRDSSFVYGTKIFNEDRTFVPLTEIKNAIVSFSMGFTRCNDKDSIVIAVGTNTSGDNFSSIAYNHGMVWADFVVSINVLLRQLGVPSDRVVAVSGIDAEPTFNTFPDTVQWFDGYNDAVSKPFNYVIGSADGCPLNSPPPQSPPGYYPPGSCLNDWTQDDVNKLSNGYASSRSIPMNYNTTGANADQWYSIGIYSFNTHNDKISFSGTMTQEAACDQVEVSDPNACAGIDNSLEFGYQQFLIRVVDESRIESPLTWGTDMKYYYGEP